MTLQPPVNAQAQVVASTDSVPVQTATQELSVQTDPASSQSVSSAETVNTGTQREEMIPRARFDQVNNKLKQIEARQSEYQIYDQFEAELAKDPELAEAIAQVVKQRKQASQPVEKPVQHETASADPMVQKLAKEVFLMKATDNVNKYQNLTMDALKTSQIPQHQIPLYKDEVEKRVISKLRGDLTIYDPNILAEAVEETKQYFGQYLNPAVPAKAPDVPVMRPNAPLQVQRFKNRDERTAYLASAMKAASNKG